MKNIHLIPTDKSSRLYLHSENELQLRTNIIRTSEDYLGSNQHIYITSDEEIKEGDYVYDSKDNVIRYVKKYLKDDWIKKIILTTDQDLIKDGVQAIDDEFLEWFIKNPSCEEVEVNDWLDANGNIAFGGDKRYQICNHLYDKIIIPKEEPKQEWTPTQGEQVWIKVFSNWSSGTYIGYDTTKHIHLVRENEEGGGNLLSSSKILPYKSMPNEPKQETLEEAAETNSEKHHYAFGQQSEFYQLGFIEGAKWMQERMYSEKN